MAKGGRTKDDRDLVDDDPVDQADLSAWPPDLTSSDVDVRNPRNSLAA